MAAATWQRDAHAMAEALFARAEGPAPARRLAWLVADLEDFLAHAGPRSRFMFHACRMATSWIAPVLVAGLPPLRRQPLARRAAALSAMEKSPLGMAVLGVKAMMSLCWYEHPDSAAEIGFDGACKT